MAGQFKASMVKFKAYRPYNVKKTVKPVSEADTDEGDPERYLKSLPIPVNATCIEDHMVEGERLQARFDAAEWFEKATLEQLITLAKQEFQSSYAADEVGEYFFGTQLKVVGTDTRDHGMAWLLKTAAKLTAEEKKPLLGEDVDDPSPELMQAAFDMPTILQRMGYFEAKSNPPAWIRTFRQSTPQQITVEVKRRGLGMEQNPHDALWDITLYQNKYDQNKGHYVSEPVVYRYGRTNVNIERVLKMLHARIDTNNLRSIRDDVAESLPEPPPEDEPTDVIKSHEKNLLAGELKRLDFGPKPEQGIEWIYGVEMPRYWWNRYTAADGKIHGLNIYFIGGQQPEVRANNWNFEAKAWFQRGNETTSDSPAQNEAHFCAIIRDLDAAMKRSAADSLSPEQEHDAIQTILKHHRKWWDDTLDYLINTKSGTIPGRIGPGQPA